MSIASPARPDFPHADWDRAPWNRWTFQHVAEIVPTATVRRRDGAAAALPEAPQDLASLAFDDGGTRRSLGQFLDESYTDGFIVLHRGRVVFERLLNGMTAQTLHLAQSVSKSVTATSLGILAARGVVDPQAPVTAYLPELEATAYRGATIQHLLDMTSGAVFDEDYTNPFSDIGKVDVASGWKPAPAAGDWPGTMWEFVLTLQKTSRPHGERFEYRSIETDILAFALERASGRRLAEIVSDTLWQPMGAGEDACFTVDSAGFALADGGFNACLRDFARFGLLWARRGVVDGRQLIPEAWVAATLAGDAGKFGAPYSDLLPRGAYRNQFWLREAGRPVLLARGVFGQLISIDLARDLVVVKLSTWPEFTSPARFRTVMAAIDAIAAALA